MAEAASGGAGDAGAVAACEESGIGGKPKCF